MIISKTPLRISFAGGGTDLPSFYRQNGYGAVLSTSIDSYVYVTVKKHTALFSERIRLNYSETELVNRLDDIQNSIIRECLRFLEIDDRIYINTIADAPSQTGLGSSSVFCVGLLNALYKFKGINVSAGRLAEEAAHIEMDVLKRPVGKQDHYAAAFGGLNYFQFHDDGSVTIKPTNVAGRVMRALFDSMISFWTRQSRAAESVLREQNDNANRNRQVLLSMRSQAKELLDLLHDERCTAEKFGRVVHDGWQMKRTLASNVTTSVLDEYYHAALKSGAYGGKISGAGGGGFLSVFSAPSDQRKIIMALENFGLVPFKFNFEAQGTSAIRFD